VQLRYPSSVSVLVTARLDLVPMTLAIVEAVVREDRAEVARLAGAEAPGGWPSKEQVARAYSSIDRIRASPDEWLWGDRLMIARDRPRRIVGSVVFRGWPDAEGTVEVAYGVEPGSQHQGFATEATRACVAWALEQPGVAAVQALTFAWHRASVRVLERVGMRVVGKRDSEIMGEMLVHEVRDRAMVDA
jgi:RimJ/RimL family protein N-acetyltransferase